MKDLSELEQMQPSRELPYSQAMNSEDYSEQCKQAVERIPGVMTGIQGCSPVQYLSMELNRSGMLLGRVRITQTPIE